MSRKLKSPEVFAKLHTEGATITPHKWHSITPNIPLFGRAMDL